MKTMKKIFAAVVMVCVAFSLASCINDDEPKSYLRGHFVIEGSNPNYTLYSNDGFVVSLNPSSVMNTTSGAGFGNNKRAWFDVSFENKNVKTVPGLNGKVETHISNAELIQGAFVTVLSPMSYASATDRNITVPDSLFDIKKFDDFWYHRGYLNLIITAPYSIKGGMMVYPTMNLAYMPIEVRENDITFRLLYNRHTGESDKPQTMEGSFVTAYSMHSLSGLVPGHDSISVTVVNGDKKTKTIKVAR